MPIFAQTKAFVDLYMLAIVSFMAGIHWGIVMSQAGSENLPLETLSKKHAKQLLILSNFFVLIPWVLLALEQTIAFYISLLIIFILLRVIDAKLVEVGMISKHYFKMRCLITVIVVTGITLMLIKQA